VVNKTPTNEKKALIVGGGIGGPVAAMALQRVGVEATVYEAHDAPADYAGLFLNTASNGLDVLRTLGIDVPARADGFPIPRMVMWSGTGKRLGEVANGVRLPDGTISVVVKRGLLQRVLREEAESRGIEVEYGKRLVSYEVAGNGGVIASFEDGTKAEGDLLVGADGIHSRVRRVMDPKAPRPSYTGLLSLGGYAHGSGIPRRRTRSTSSSASRLSLAIWSGSRGRSGGSPTSRAPTSRPGRSSPLSPQRSGSGVCSTCSQATSTSSGRSSSPRRARSAPTRSTTYRPPLAGTRDLRS
jgi:2-polyprenyl-6-methoxyphenol hydroxylase-like FAD-dependent oxidoreductase